MRGSDAQQQSATRLVSALSALRRFLFEAECRQCEVLQICLRHLQEDAAERPSLYPRSLLHALRRVSSFTYVRRRSPCRRCVPSEILAAYLTPGEEVATTGRSNLPALSWITDGEELHW
jgi:hypothetical protein